MKTRAAAAKILTSIHKNYFNYEKEVRAFLDNSGFSQRDENLIYNFVNGVIQYKKYLDFVIKISCKRNIKKLDVPVLNLLRVGVYQAKILKTPDHAFIYETVEAVKELNLLKAVPFVNGVLRNLPDSKAMEDRLNRFEPHLNIATRYSHPEWLVKRWVENFGFDDTKKILDFNNSYQDIFFRYNPVKISWEKLLEQITILGENPKITKIDKNILFSVGSPGKLLKSDLFQQGYFSVQDLSQVLAVILLSPQKDEKIIDLCAAPGGKTTLIAQITGQSGNLIANDISEEKIKLIQYEFSRLGIDDVNYSTLDASVDKLPDSDKILVDVPCSGTGVFTKRADMRWNRSADDLIDLCKLQYKILENVAKYVKKGGVIVYSTCSIEPEENHKRIIRFLKKHKDFYIQNARDFVDSQYCNNEGFVQIFPQKHNITGSFAARLVRG